MRTQLSDALSQVMKWRSIQKSCDASTVFTKHLDQHFTQEMSGSALRLSRKSGQFCAVFLRSIDESSTTFLWLQVLDLTSAKDWAPAPSADGTYLIEATTAHPSQWQLKAVTAKHSMQEVKVILTAWT